MIIRLKRKLYTKWDETDNLKRMKDSDILAEKKKKQSVGRNAANTAAGAIGFGAVGAGLGAAAGAGLGAMAAGKGNRLAGLGKAGRGAIVGASIGAGASMLNSFRKQNKQANENKAYNQRLAYAQRQAQRRERRDWKTNMTQRDGYQY